MCMIFFVAILYFFHSDGVNKLCHIFNGCSFLQYLFLKRSNTNFQDYVLNQVSILEALIHDNPTLSLANSTTAYNVMIGDVEFNVEDEEYEDYFIAGWDFSCEHLSNLG